MIRAGAATTKDNVHVFSNVGPLLVSHYVHGLAKEAIREAKFDTVILSHFGMTNFRRKACVDVMLDFVPQVKLARNDIKIVKYDFGPQLRYLVMKEKFPNVEKFVSLHVDGKTHSVVWNEGRWISEDILIGLRAKGIAKGSENGESGTSSGSSDNSSSDSD